MAPELAYTPHPYFYAEITVDVVRCKADLFRPGFPKWLKDNFHVWRSFEHVANEIWARGRRHYSARTIVEVLRHETALREPASNYKINDWNTPDMARLYVLMWPERQLFKLRGRN